MSQDPYSSDAADHDAAIERISHDLIQTKAHQLILLAAAHHALETARNEILCLSVEASKYDFVGDITFEGMIGDLDETIINLRGDVVNIDKNMAARAHHLADMP